MSVIVSTKLSIDDYVNLRKLCEQRGCSTYYIAKEAIQEYLRSHPDAPETAHKSGGPAEEQPTMEPPEPETVEINAENVSEKVMEILKGRSE